MKRVKLIVCFLIAFVSVSSVQAQLVEEAEFGKFAITNATIHTITNGVIKDGTVLIEGETISYVGDEMLELYIEFEVIDAAGNHLFPGFMDAGSQLGLVEVGSLDLTKDAREVGDFTPQMRAFTAINPSSVSIPVTRINAITHVISLPIGGRIAGKATLINLYGYTPDSMAVVENAALHLIWPSATSRGWWDERGDKEIKEDYRNELEELKEFWNQAVFYNKMWSAYEKKSVDKTKPKQDAQMAAMRKVVTGQIPVIISVGKKKDILNALDWIEKHNNAEFILAGCQQGWRVAEKIAEAGVPCIIGTLYTPRRDYVNYQRPYQNPGKLYEAGVKLAFATGSAENVRNLPFHAGFAVSYGLPKQAAFKALTIWPAQIFGVADKLGSIEVGKQANLFISTGDPLQPWTHIKQVFIRGYKIPMISRQTQLHEIYLNRGPEKKDE